MTSALPAVVILGETSSIAPIASDWADSPRHIASDPRELADALAGVFSRTTHGVGDTNRANIDTTNDAVLIWAARLGPLPPAEVVLGLLEDPGVEVAHAGLALGLAGLPLRFHQVAPTWMLNLDPSAELPGTSWRVALDAALIRRSVVEQAGGLDPAFDTLAGCGLEAGHRWIRSGALMQSRPELMAHLDRLQNRPAPMEAPGANDEVRLLLRRHGRLWTAFALLTQPPKPQLWGKLSAVLSEAGIDASPLNGRPQVAASVSGTAASPGAPQPQTTVSVVIPTIDRAQWLRVVLDQLRRQTVAPHQVVVIDQSGPRYLDPDIAEDFADLPLVYRRQSVEGQSTARNEALRLVTGDVVLFLDDDDEIEPDLIQRHLDTLSRFAADVVSGVADEPSSGPLPHDFTYLRAGDVLGTNNASVRRRMLEQVGGFDLAFDHGPRADLDLGIRLHLAGARMILDPSIRVLHHRAPRGGLRTFDARKVTRGSSRQAVLATVPTSATELYLWRQHFGPIRARQAARIRLLSGLIGSGAPVKRVARLVAQAAKILTDAPKRRAADNEAGRLRRQHPTIPNPWSEAS